MMRLGLQSVSTSPTVGIPICDSGQYNTIRIPKAAQEKNVIRVRDITLAESVIAGCSLYWCLSLVWTITTRSGNLTWTSIGNYLMQIFYLLTKHHVRSCKDLCCPSRSSTELSALLCCPEKSFPHKMIIGKCR